jgi:hypothetical protein
MTMSSPESTKVAEILRTIAAAVETLSPSELREFTHKLNKEIAVQSNSEPDRANERRDADRTKLLELIDLLHRCETRDGGLSLIRAAKLSRRELVEIGRICSVHIVKDDKIARIEEKIVEAIVGSRLNSEAIRGTRFTHVNARIIEQTNARIVDEIENRRFKFVFNPETGSSKILSFKPNGEIGEGRNGNEFSWSVSDGRLEIKNDRGKIYSRFFMTPDGRLYHTNDPETLSIKGQYLEPI